MVLNNGYNQYKQNSIFTASPEELTLMLYNGLVKFIMQAQAGAEEKDIQKAHDGCIRAQQIIVELQSTLDMRYEVSKGLMSIYDYMYNRLIEANIKKDKAILDEVLEFAKELRETWSQAMKLAKQQGNSQQLAK